MTHQNPAPVRACAPAEPAVLVRLRVDGLDWSEHLPPAPQGNDVSVSFSRPTTAARHAEPLSALGYRVVRIHALRTSGPAGSGPAGSGPAASSLTALGLADNGEFVDLVVYGDTAHDHPSWWRALSALAERIYPLMLGPAAMQWAALVAAHAEGQGRP